MLSKTLWSISILCLVIGIILFCCGCNPTPDYVAEYQARPRIEKPDQEPMLPDEYPEWANKKWKHLIVEPIRNYGPGRMFSQAHYYIDLDSFNEKHNSYTTIENYTVVLSDEYVMTQRITDKDIRGHFEGFDERGYIFPCVKIGRWHSGMDGLMNSEYQREGDITKCEHCGRYYLTGTIEFQRETGHPTWSCR